MIRTIRDVQQSEAAFGHPVITIGNFDGVHRGHQALLREVKVEAESRQVSAVVFTFEPHPIQVLAPEKALPMLQTIPQRVRMFETMGMDGVILYPFDPSFAALTAREFVDRILVDALHISAIIIGSDFRFGAGRAGNVALLKEYGKESGFDVLSFNEVSLEGEIISSSRIRQAIMEGDMSAAETYLGRPYSVQGKVVDGIKLGKKLGYPTANVNVFNQLLPRNGVYAVEGHWRDRYYSGAASVGVRPTIDTGVDVVQRERVLEVHLLDFQKNIYDEDVEIFFHIMLRPEYRFNAIGDLVRQMGLDVEQCRQFFQAKDRRNQHR